MATKKQLYENIDNRDRTIKQLREENKRLKKEAKERVRNSGGGGHPIGSDGIDVYGV